MKKIKQQLTALIDNGKFSGKEPWVCSINKEKIHPVSYQQELIDGGYCFLIKISVKEYNYLQKIPGAIEVKYNSEGKNINEKFYY